MWRRVWPRLRAALARARVGALLAFGQQQHVLQLNVVQVLDQLDEELEVVQHWHVIAVIASKLKRRLRGLTALVDVVIAVVVVFVIVVVSDVDVAVEETDSCDTVTIASTPL